MALWRSSSSWCWWACWSRRSVAPALTALAGICRGRALAWRSPLQIDPQGCPPLWNLGPPRLTMSPYTLSRLKFFPDFFAHQIRGCARVRGGRILLRSTGASRCAGSAAPAFCPRPCRKCVFVPTRLPCGTNRGPLLAGGRGMSRRIQPVMMVELRRVILTLFRWLLFIMLAAVVASA